MSDVPSQGVRIGPILRERRETLGLSLGDAENTIHIRAKYLAALETDAWHELPGEIVGRGFLQNYAEFLQLDVQDLKLRRQQDVASALGDAWNAISAGTQMPPPRGLDYRPMTVRMSGEAFEARTDRPSRGIRWLITLALVALAVLVVAGIWQGMSLRSNSAPAAQPARLATVYRSVTDTVVSFVQATTVRMTDLLARPAGPDQVAIPLSTATPILAVEVPQVTFTPTPTVVGTSTPVPELTPTVLPVQTDNTLAAANCPNEWARIVAPLESQVISGEVRIMGTAFHADPDFWYYKLERAEGDRVFLYFAGQQQTVENGELGILDTRFMVNGNHTLRLTVVNVSAGDPLVCDVGVIVQN